MAHGAAGWSITFLIWFAAWNADWIFKLLHPAKTELELRQQVGYTLDHILIPGFLIGLGVGLLVFETFAYLGLRRCKYANCFKPDSKPDPTSRDRKGAVSSVGPSLDGLSSDR